MNCQTLYHRDQATLLQRDHFSGMASDCTPHYFHGWHWNYPAINGSPLMEALVACVIVG